MKVLCWPIWTGVILAILAVGVTSARAELVSEWRLDGNAKDSVGTNHGTLHGDPVWVEDRYGNPGKALKLDGQNDNINCGSDASLSFSDGKTDRPFSISAWVKMDTVGGFSIAAKGGEYWVDNNNAFRFRVICKGDFIGGILGGLGRQKDKWTHLALTYDGSGQAEGIMMHVNGSAGRRTEASGSYTAMKPAKGDFIIGRSSKYSHGVIDDVQVFNHALTPVEIKKLVGALFDLDVQKDVKILQRQGGQSAAEVAVNVTNLSPLPRKAILRATLSASDYWTPYEEQMETVERDGILFSSGTHHHTIAVPFPATASGRIGLGKLSVVLEDSEQQRVVCRHELYLRLEDYRPLRVDVLRPHYQNAVFAGQKLDEIVLEIHAAVEMKKKQEYAFEFLLKSEPDTILRHEQRIEAEQTVVTVPLPSLKEGSYRMEGRLVQRPNGKVIGEWQDVLRKLPARRGEVRFDEDWVCWIDNERFLPFGIFSDWWPKGIWDTIALGCNAIECPSIRLEEKTIPYLDELHQAGIKLVVMPFPHRFEGLKGMTPELAQELRSHVRRKEGYFLEHPAILAWYTGNEPRPPLSPKTMKQIHDIMTEEDPYHPTVIINHRINYISLYSDATALVMPDPYPYYARSAGWERPRYPTRAVREAVRASRGRKPVWALLQGHNMTLFGRSNSRAPHFGDLRNQLYQAAIAGAKGFFWYCRYWIEPHVEIGLTYLAKEVAALRDAILAPESPNQFAPAGGDAPEDLHLSRREVGEHAYLFAVSSSHTPRELAFRAALLADGPLFVVGEARQVEVRGGKFTDSFEPYDTHVYTTSEGVARQLDIAAVLKEIETAYNPPLKPGNLAQKGRGTKVEVSEEYDSCPPFEYIIDGSKWSSWHSEANLIRGKEQWVDVVFAEPQKVSRVVIDSNISHLEIQIPDGEAWTTLAEAKSAGKDARREVQTVRFPEVETARLRVLVKAVKGGKVMEDGLFQIWEIEAYRSVK